MNEIIFLAIVAVAVTLLITEWLRPDIVALLIILSLYITRLLRSDQALAGFASEPAIVIACMFVLSAGIESTGLSELLGQSIGRFAGQSYTRMLAVIMPAAALLSAFTHHVTITAILLPVMLTLARERKIAPSRLLMPMAIGSSLGTTITIIGAPSFLIASELLRESNRPGLEVFSIAPIGIALTVAGTLYLVLLGRFLLPSRKGGDTEDNRFRLDNYVTELAVLPGSNFEGKTTAEITADRTYDLRVIGCLEQGRSLRRRNEGRPLRAGDVLLVRTTPDALATIRHESGVELQPAIQYGEDVKSAGEGAPGKDAGDIPDQLVQAVVAPRSSLAGRTIGDVDFRRRYGVIVLGIWRAKRMLPQELARIRLEAGDVLVLEGPTDAAVRLGDERDFLMLVPFHGQVRQRRKALMAGVIMLVTVLLAAFSIMSLAMAALTGAVAMVLSGALTVRQGYRAIDARLYIFVAGAIPLGAAMKSSGTAHQLASVLQHGIGSWNERLILLALFGTVAIVVQFMGSDSATVALFGPVAIALAVAVHQAPEPYIITVAMAAVAATLTPLAHHNLLIYAPGGYKFTDYTRVGAPLTVIIGLVVTTIAPLLWRS